MDMMVTFIDISFSSPCGKRWVIFRCDILLCALSGYKMSLRHFFNLHHAKAMKAMGYEEEEGRAAPAPAMKPKAWSKVAGAEKTQQSQWGRWPLKVMRSFQPCLSATGLLMTVEKRLGIFFHDSCQCYNSTSFHANSSGCGGTSRLNFLKHLFFVICRVQVPGVWYFVRPKNDKLCMWRRERRKVWTNVEGHESVKKANEPYRVDCSC